ncbi:MAG: aminoglycoside phosphotransferase family protein [Candidatus Electrothrix sp. YB6]
MDDKLLAQACRILGDQWQPDKVQTEPLTPDGSLRRFCRILHRDGRTAVAVTPPPGDTAGLQEAAAGWHIGRHLAVAEAPVPQLYGFDEQSGLLVCEDLGNTRLHDLLLQKGLKNRIDSEQIIGLYRQAVTGLAGMQVNGSKNFDPSWCWDTPRYDRRVMLERESGYFIQALCYEFLHLQLLPAEQDIQEEFSALADQAAQADASFFLHRDFQSRNIMVQQGQVYFIDYQAGRLGPLAYDLASLLIDPYVALPQQLQNELLECYLDTLTDMLPYDRHQFRQEYLLLALQRNLQILGAFAFLSQQRGRVFFRQYLKPALFSLQGLLADFFPGEIPCLRSLTDRCLAALKKQPEV